MYNHTKMNLSNIFLDMYNKNIDLDVIINSILVYEDVRNSFLLELHSKNYGKTIDVLKNTFKTFKFIILQSKIDSGDNIYGTLVMKNTTEIPSAYRGENNVFDITDMEDTHTDLGIFLSYPCAGDIHHPDFFLNIDVKYDKNWTQLIGMACIKRKNFTSLKNFLNQIKKCIESINSHLKIPIKIKISFNKAYTFDDIIKLYSSNKINKKIIAKILQIFNQGNFVILSLLHKDKIFDLDYDKFNEHIMENTCKYTEFVINAFDNMYNIKIDRDKYLKKVYHITRESVANIK